MYYFTAVYINWLTLTGKCLLCSAFSLVTTNLKVWLINSSVEINLASPDATELISWVWKDFKWRFLTFGQDTMKWIKDGFKTENKLVFKFAYLHVIHAVKFCFFPKFFMIIEWLKRQYNLCWVKVSRIPSHLPHKAWSKWRLQIIGTQRNFSPKQFILVKYFKIRKKLSLYF